MSFVRVQKVDKFVQIDKFPIQDKRLSWKAKGILIYLLSLPNDWKVYMKEIQQHATDGETSFKNGIKELKEFGYLKRYAVRNEVTGKISHWETVVVERPEYEVKESQNQVDEPLQTQQNQPEVQNPPTGFNHSVENPLVGNQLVEKPLVDNDQLLILNNTNNDLTKNNSTNKQTNNTQNEKVSSSVSQELQNQIHYPEPPPEFYEQQYYPPSEDYEQSLQATPTHPMLNDQVFARITTYYEQNLGIITPAIRDRIAEFVDEFRAIEIELIERALTDASMNPSARNKLSYASGTLRNLLRANIHTLQAYEMQLRNEQSKKQGGNDNAINNKHNGQDGYVNGHYVGF